MDVNGNGSLTSADSTLVQQANYGISAGDLAAMDVNGNGAVNLADSTLILQAFYGIEPCL